MHEAMAMIASMLMSIYMTSLFSSVHQQGQNRVVYAAAASQFQSLLNGTKSYVDANSAQILASVPVGSITQLGLSTLISANDLPPNFTASNPFGQYWQVFLTQPQSGQIEAYVDSSGGTVLNFSALSAVVGMAGGQSGFVPPDNVVASLNSGIAIGNMGKWRLPLSGLPNPGAGHFYGIATASASAQYNSDVLYRDNIPGHPELNTMNAPLGMNGNNINAIGSAQVNNNVSVGNQITAHSERLDPGNSLQIGNASMYGDGQNAAIRAPERLFVQHPDGSFAPISAGSLGLPSGNNLTEGSASFYGDDNNAAIRTPGQVYMQHQDGSLAPLAASTITASNAVQLSANATAGAGCSNNGLISASSDGSGTTLNCVNGRWSILGATFNNGSWVSGTLALNATSGPFTNNAIT
ncbi:shufflon system plasmid conjugative transfer pilus tip adhesin PilV, partial [Asaia sp. SF2.1]|uniref:shufflon system plasmid conjugative transfer pilus tip adhesin PilV n=1 Tax=Asaia sp. SF2.1 TaxID=406101 RepID=UPI0003D2A675